MALEKRGAEAVVLIEDDKVVKTRVKKSYRIDELDERLRRERTRAEAKIMSEARKLGIPTPIIYDVGRFDLIMETITGVPLKDVIDEDSARKAGVLVGKLHGGGIIHGDLTTSNMLVKGDMIYLIDFGLSFWDEMLESRGVDVHVFYQTLISSHKDHEKLMAAFAEGYRSSFKGADEVLERVKEIEYRGRYKTEAS
ncbi:Kae1-associated kinase Bud32 [Methanocella conradii HZ254]|uniref:non-specific serine/threonine protein kinase n=1 Tax=Methanocella conradii (strain DSM 24694 / JCM 17849 / CGMCC 1.5162 / HZ254) TaxID=1041930 RepID=H8I885_METCZ|nr:Kae1-associated kinase Bud32 [Methanocella conradii]AFD00903.1 Kae1-associated kinase Bud32 [Methanocella conradii HZ254]MDI6897584.1 Kae1-associated kinase Bud32 [Methanocella conradii]